MQTEKEFIKLAWEKAGFGELTPIQAKTIPIIKEGKNVIAESPTGTGKTLAYLLPILEKVTQEKKSVQALIIAPTRELTMQIHQQIQAFTQGSELKSSAFIGGADIKRQMEKLKLHPAIVVGTPERLMELIRLKKLKMHDVKTIVVDEADHIVKLEQLGTVREILASTQKDRQLIFVSATIPPQVEKAAQELMVNPEMIRIQPSDLPPSKVEHLYMVCEPRDKWDLLRRIVKMDEPKAIAFLNDARHLEAVADRLRNKEITVGILGGDMKKTERETIMNQFRTGKFALLIATDLAARGLDIEGITHVFHFDLPQSPEQYVHRSGRTGRMGAPGKVISLVTSYEVPKLEKLAKGLKIPISEKHLYMGEMVGEKPPQQRPQKKANKRF